MALRYAAGHPVINPSRRLSVALTAFLVVGFGGVLLLLAPATRAADEKPKPAPKPAAAPARSPAKPAAPAQPAFEPAKGDSSLSFSDDDLEKYHRPKPADEVSDEETTVGDEDDATVPEASSAAGKAPAAGSVPGAAAPAPVRAKPTPPRPNPVLGPPPVEDPLKKWKEQGALQTMRQQQIGALRERIAGLKGRLEYLHLKEDGLRNPGPPQPGSTRGPDYGADHKPDISPGRPQPALGVIFPALPPPQTDEDRESDKTMKIPALLDKVKAEIETVEADLKRANDDLIAIETRATAENAQP